MITLWHIGNYKGDIPGKLGWMAIRLGQWRQRYERATHCEALLDGNWKRATICGASLRDDKMVRAKVAELKAKNWIVINVPKWEQHVWESRVRDLIGKPYSIIGAVSSASPFWSLVFGIFSRKKVVDLNQWCSRLILDGAGVIGAEDMSVSEALTYVMNLEGSTDITREFFERDPDEFQDDLTPPHPFLAATQAFIEKEAITK